MDRADAHGNGGGDNKVLGVPGVLGVLEVGFEVRGSGFGV